MVFSQLKKDGEIHNQAELAKAIGASEATISKALKGEEKSLTDNLFKRISKRFVKYSLDWMVKGEGIMCCSDVTDEELLGKNSSHDKGSEADKDKEIAMLRQLLDEKERTIRAKDQTIELLLSQREGKE